MARVFISYSRQDADFMRRLRADFQAAGIDTWVDETGLSPGTPAWTKAIEEAIEGSDGVVVLLSPEAKDSRWVGLEMRYADMMHVRLFPVLVRGDERSAVPIALADTQWVDARVEMRYETAARELINAVRTHADPGATLADSPVARTRPRKIIPAIVIGAVAGLAALVAAGVLVFGLPGQPTPTPTGVAAAPTSAPAEPTNPPADTEQPTPIATQPPAEQPNRVPVWFSSGCEVPTVHESDYVVARMGWGTETMEGAQLSQEHLSFVVKVDGVARNVSLEQTPIQTPDDDTYGCGVETTGYRFYNDADVGPLEPGPHTITAEYYLDQTITLTGEGTYEAGLLGEATVELDVLPE